jgi:MFS superfamily sulfate permease-like transporter
MFVWFSDLFDRAESTFSVYMSVLICLMLAIIFVYVATKKLHLMSIPAILILTFLFWIINTNTYGDNLHGALPSVSYPNPPHLGLDGISINNRVLVPNM